MSVYEEEGEAVEIVQVVFEMIVENVATVWISQNLEDQAERNKGVHLESVPTL